MTWLTAFASNIPHALPVSVQCTSSQHCSSWIRRYRYFGACTSAASAAALKQSFSDSLIPMRGAMKNLLGCHHLLLTPQRCSKNCLFQAYWKVITWQHGLHGIVNTASLENCSMQGDFQREQRVCNPQHCILYINYSLIGISFSDGCGCFALMQLNRELCMLNFCSRFIKVSACLCRNVVILEPSIGLLLMRRQAHMHWC